MITSITKYLMKFHVHPQISTVQSIDFGMDEHFHPTLYLCLPILKLKHFHKIVPLCFKRLNTRKDGESTHLPQLVYI